MFSNLVVQSPRELLCNGESLGSTPRDSDTRDQRWVLGMCTFNTPRVMLIQVIPVNPQAHFVNGQPPL